MGAGTGGIICVARIVWTHDERDGRCAVAPEQRHAVVSGPLYSAYNIGMVAAQMINGKEVLEKKDIIIKTFDEIRSGIKGTRFSVQRSYGAPFL